MTWLRSLKATALSGLAVQRRRLEPLPALRAAGGLALVVLVSVAAGGPATAVSSAFGAFQAAMATFQRSWRPRPTLALASGLSLAVSTFLGYLCGGHPVAFLALLAVWTFVSGLAWTAGPAVGLIASSNVAMTLVTVTLPTSVGDAAAHAAVIAAGGVVQAGLIVLFPVRGWGPQRDALADALAAVADYARRLRHDPYAPFDPVPLMTARSAAAVTPRQARRRPGELHGARGPVERIRPVLASLADPVVGVPAEGPGRDRVRELLGAAGEVLDAAARAVRRGRPPDVPPGVLAALRAPDTPAVLGTAPARRAADRLAGLLEEVVRAAAPGGRRAAPEELRARPGLLSLVPVAVRGARAEARDRDSPYLRHAIRVTAVTTAGYLLGSALPLGHGYWAPLAAVMSMRPDFGQTYARSVARLAGTLVGVALATGVVRLADPGAYASAGLAVAAAFATYLLLRTGYTATQVFLCAYVVFLLGMAGGQWTQTVRERVVLTLLGGALAMLAYAVYPAWETPRLRSRLADWLAASARYAAEVLERYARPDRPAAGAVREALLEARAARIAWREAVERAAHEPVRHRGPSEAATDAAGRAIGRFSRAAMLLEAHPPHRSAAPSPGAAALAGALRGAAERGAADVREGRVPRWDGVRAVLGAAEGSADPVVRAAARRLLESLEELSEALDTW
ncbi:FUSC family protein [Streptomyces somaliensis]|uniref:FUSC family protein n=1 Tax=Streptomyces somaliensis TaxID=78355 RepID=UPI0020CE2FB9|nr:FUSC family protein [Streptomyces somaliensis]MCP9946926.1 FUSC family protein [Streptomyces somaliensis]MCP9963560.1 FUSC family protein [Streptomyces somaliensis]MCP9976101.1 FUSC family protein [Streptomyces somaliensis]MCP9976171.1 FUSC family protein [Streptomyces somaliensis]